MKAGMVAGGIVIVFLGFSWWYVLGAVARLAPGASIGLLDAVWLLCVLPIVLIIIGFMVFLAGLVGKSKEELAAMQPRYMLPPQVVYVQGPPRAPPAPPVAPSRPPPPRR